MYHDYASDKQNYSSKINKSFLNKKRYENDIVFKYPKNDYYKNYTFSSYKQNRNNLNAINRFHGNCFIKKKEFFKNSNNNDSYRRHFKKFNDSINNENIINLSNCEIISSPPLSHSSTKSTEYLERTSRINSPNNKNVVNIYSLNNRNESINFSDSSNNKQSNINIKSSDNNKESNKSNIDKNTININLQNPLDEFVLYPDYLYQINSKSNNNLIQSNNKAINEKNKNMISDVLAFKSSYLLKKIPNWRLVTKFVPGKELSKEQYDNIITLNEDLDKDGNNEKFTKGKKYPIICNDKYEDMVEDFIKDNINKKKSINSRIFYEKLIIVQYHNDILKFKNKLKQGIFKINYLSIKQENYENSL